MNPYLRSGFMAAGVALAAMLLVLGFRISDTGSGITLPPEVERIIPADGSLVSPQAQVGVDLLDDHTGVLAIDGREIPEDQLVRVDSLGQLFFSPGEDRDIEAFEPGRHSITVSYWPKTQTRDAAEDFTWQFQVG